jgi:hypothetical protein
VGPRSQLGNEVGRAYPAPTRLIGTEAFTTGGSASGKRYSSAQRQNAQNRIQARDGVRGDRNAAANCGLDARAQGSKWCLSHLSAVRHERQRRPSFGCRQIDVAQLPARRIRLRALTSLSKNMPLRRRRLKTSPQSSRKRTCVVLSSIQSGAQFGNGDRRYLEREPPVIGPGT